MVVHVLHAYSFQQIAQDESWSPFYHLSLELSLESECSLIIIAQNRKVPIVGFCLEGWAY